MGNTLFRNARLIDGNGGDPRERVSVFVENDIIREIADGDRSFSSAHEVIDCRGNTLMPGLIDGHMHLGLIEVEVINIVRRNPTGLIAARMLRNLREALDQGYTSVRDLGGSDVGFRMAVESGDAVGPRMQVCGPVIAQSGGHGDNRVQSEYRPYYEGAIGFRARLADGVPEVLRVSRENLREGADFLKIMACGGCASPTGGPNANQYTASELRAAVDVAEAAGTYVASHCYSDRSIRLSVEAGIRTIEHGNLMESDTARLMAVKGAYHVPTQITYEVVIERNRENISKFIYDKFVEVNERGYEAIRIAEKAGVKIGGGSDLTSTNTRYASGAVSYQAKAQGPMGAIVSFTKTNAEIMNMSDAVGTVEPGKYADILLVAGDPLTDIGLFKNHRDNLLVIMKDGRIHKRII